MNHLCPVTILLAEDDDGHATLIKKNLKRSNVTNPVLRFYNGKQLLDHLNTVSTEGLVILLDLNMPVMNGFQALEAIKADERMKLIPTIILTTTDDDREVQKCYELGCNVYISKPVEYENFSKAIQSLGLFLTVVATPKPVSL